jgi:hypothetical protein
MSFVLPLRPSRSTRPVRPSKQLQPPDSPRRRPSLATRGRVLKRRKSSVTSFNAPSLRFFEGIFGDEFPEAFSRSDGRLGKRCATILGLPTEMLQIICAFLSKSDLKRLRLASSELAERVELRIDRVFISPNRANLRCLDAVLGHPRYRLQVEEIVWDDSQLEAFPSLKNFDDAIRTQEAVARRKIHGHLEDFLSRERYHEDNDSGDVGLQTLEPDDLFLPNGHLTDYAKTLLLRLENQAARDIIARNGVTMMSIEDSYDLYQKLYQDEQEIMKRGLDVKVLHRALAEFPNVKRITLTTDVWKSEHSPPSYDTPFFRALPSGFRKPTVWPWLARRPDRHAEWVAHRMYTMQQTTKHRLPFEWRAYSIIMSSLVAVPHPGIEAIIIDTEYEEAGISHQLFNAPNEEYDTTVEACQILNLRMFKFAINSYGTSEIWSPYLESSLLKDLFSSMRYLEHLDFRPNADTDSRNFYPDVLFSEATLHRLKHFTLRNAKVTEEDLYGLISKLRNAESITLYRIILQHGTYHSLLYRLREYFATTGCSPRLTIMNDCILAAYLDIHRVCLCCKGVNEFLYNNGICPFSEGQGFPMESGSDWLTNDNDWDPARWKRFDHKYAHKLLQSRNTPRASFPGIDSWRFDHSP